MPTVEAGHASKMSSHSSSSSSSTQRKKHKYGSSSHVQQGPQSFSVQMQQEPHHRSQSSSFQMQQEPHHRSQSSSVHIQQGPQKSQSSSFYMQQGPHQQSKSSSFHTQQGPQKSQSSFFQMQQGAQRSQKSSAQMQQGANQRSQSSSFHVQQGPQQRSQSSSVHIQQVPQKSQNSSMHIQQGNHRSQSVPVMKHSNGGIGTNHGTTHATTTHHVKRNTSTESSYGHMNGLEAGKKLGIKPTLSAREFTTPDVDELGVMSYAARFQHTAPWPKENSYVLSEPPPPKVHWAECVQLTSVQVQDKVTPGHNALKNTIHGIVNVPVVLRLHVINTKATLKDIRAELQAPGQPVAISLKALASDQVDLTFVPLQEGLHKLSIWCRDDVIDGFPINLMIEPDKASFPKNIRIGTMSSASVGEQLQFQVDVSDAGYGELLVEINNGFNQLPVRIVRQGKVFTVHTQAKECGTYNVFIKWNGEDITEDPMKIEVHDASQCVATGEGLSRAKEDQPAVFTVDTRSAGKGELRVIVEGPHSIAKCSIDKNTSGTYTVTYIPVEVGLFSIKVTWNGKDIYGSPFHPKVTDPRKVRVVGGHVPGMGDNGIINMTHRKAYLLELSTAEAGPGKMVADLQLPSNRRVHLPIELEADGRATMRFVPEEEGDYMLRILWNDHLIKGSPYRMTCRQKRVPVDHTRVRCHGPGLQQSKVSQLSEFFIDGSQAGPGVPNLRMSGVKSDIMVTLIPQGNNIYKAVFTPDIAGAYLLHLTWSDRQVPGSPFKLNVADAAHANRVHASGAALKTIVANQTSRLVIDSREAGSGELTARCVGPNTMAEVHIGDNRNGTYSLLISPSEPGRHTLEVKYGEDHIQGSPFLLRVAAPPDASKVRCFGPGLEHGILSSFNGRFICETKGAGAGQLKVRIHGPKGAFKVEMRRSDTKDRTIDVRYNPNESGEYAIQVKWSDKHVPGSPFIVKVVENREELHALKRDMANGRQSSKDMTNGWSEEI
ncbi:filamin-C-like isoform X2 [Asterias rubens]|uniref:filamin-C-like isoform X2 n=1 Tax=Asterias rubens TaxID=7604 RepID=UPI0014552585|nr:filamin-C-like isoform X2 [Asterias rubens]